MTARLAFPRLSRLTGALAAAAVLSGCHQAADLTDARRPVARPSLQLQLRPVTGDTVTMVLSLEGTDPAASIGSLTAEVALPLPSGAGWQLAECEGAQGAPLLACHVADPGVRLAAAWTGGTHAGDLVRLTFTRRTGMAAQDAPFADARLRVTQVSSVAGAALGTTVDVREEVRR